MLVQNEKVIKAFLRGERASSPKRNLMWGGYDASISTDGVILWSYSTPIAKWDGEDTVAVNPRKYSATTSRQQSDLKTLIDKFGYKVADWA